MNIKKITPIHQAISTIDATIKTLKLQREALAAALPEETPQKAPQTLTHPLTGKVFKIRRR